MYNTNKPNNKRERPEQLDHKGIANENERANKG